MQNNCLLLVCCIFHILFFHSGFVCLLGISLEPKEDLLVPMPDPLLELSQKVSDDGLFIPQSSITIQNVVGEGKNQLLAIYLKLSSTHHTKESLELYIKHCYMTGIVMWLQ